MLMRISDQLQIHTQHPENYAKKLTASQFWHYLCA